MRGSFQYLILIVLFSFNLFFLKIGWFWKCLVCVIIVLTAAVNIVTIIVVVVVAFTIVGIIVIAAVTTTVQISLLLWFLIVPTTSFFILTLSVILLLFLLWPVLLSRQCWGFMFDPDIIIHGAFSPLLSLWSLQFIVVCLFPVVVMIDCCVMNQKMQRCIVFLLLCLVCWNRWCIILHIFHLHNASNSVFLDVWLKSGWVGNNQWEKSGSFHFLIICDNFDACEDFRGWLGLQVGLMVLTLVLDLVQPRFWRLFWPFNWLFKCLDCLHGFSTGVWTLPKRVTEQMEWCTWKFKHA